MVVPYGDASLGRLAFARACRGLSDDARQLACEAAAPGAAGAPLAAAAQLRDQAEELLQLAVVAERLAGASWQRVGDALGVRRQAANVRFAAAERAARADLLFPARPGASALAVHGQLAAPAAAARDLLEWASAPPSAGDRADVDELLGAAFPPRTLADEQRALDALAALAGAEPGALPAGVTPADVERVAAARAVAHAELQLALCQGDAHAARAALDAARARHAELTSARSASAASLRLLTCLDCDHRFDPGVEESCPLYECEHCGVEFTPLEGNGGNRCPECSRFSPRVGPGRCPECESDALVGGAPTRSRRERSPRHEAICWGAYLALADGDPSAEFRRMREVAPRVWPNDAGLLREAFVRALVEEQRAPAEPGKAPWEGPQAGKLLVPERAIAALIARAERAQVRVELLADEHDRLVQIAPLGGAVALIAQNAPFVRARDGAPWAPAHGAGGRPCSTDPGAWAEYVDAIVDGDERERDARVAAAILLGVDYPDLVRARGLALDARPR